MTCKPSHKYICDKKLSKHSRTGFLLNYNEFMNGNLQKYHRLFGVVGGVIALVVAVIYLKVIPEEASIVGGLNNMILMYGHSLCWILLSAASILWAIMKKNKWSEFLAFGALFTYFIFISTLLSAKFT